ncbi:MAG: serine hydrolase domain-containing protein [Bacteroidales bacterium]
MKKLHIYILSISLLISTVLVLFRVYIDQKVCAKNKAEVQIPVSNIVLPIDSLIHDIDQERIISKGHALDSLFKRLQKRTGLNGTVLFAEKGRVIFKGAYGNRNFRRGESLQVQDSFQLASVSKMFAATAIMILKEEGKLDYDDDVTNYLYSFPYEGVHIRHLLNHRSGLPRYMSLAHEYWQDKTLPLDNQSMLSLFSKYVPKPYFKPGHGFHYCNTNYALLANIVEEVSGVSFDEFVKEKIFRKCKMTHSFVYQMHQDTTVSAYIPYGIPGYNLGYRYPRKVRNDYLNGVMGDKNVYSSVEDLFMFDQALKTGQLVSLENQKEAYTPGYKKARKKDYYGFGWRIKPERDSTVYHFGWWKGFRTFFIRDLAQDKTIIMLTNTDKGVSSSWLWKILDDDSFDLAPICRLPMEDNQDDNYANSSSENDSEANLGSS